MKGMNDVASALAVLTLCAAMCAVAIGDSTRAVGFEARNPRAAGAVAGEEATAIVFDNGTVTTGGTINVKAGDFEDGVSVPLKGEEPVPGEPFNFSGSISVTDGIGQSTGSVEIDFTLVDPVAGVHEGGFSLDGLAAGSFEALFPFQFMGEVSSIVQTSLEFGFAAEREVEMQATIEQMTDAFNPGANVSAQVQLFTVGGGAAGNGGGLLCSWQLPGDPASCVINVDPLTNYHLFVLLEAEGEFDDEINGMFAFSTAFDLQLLVLEPKGPAEPTCELSLQIPGAGEKQKCFDPGDVLQVSADVFDGAEPFMYDWGFTNPQTDWQLIGGQGTEAVAVQVGEDELVELCLTVTDSLEQQGECCMMLCATKEPPPPPAPVCSLPEEVECIETGQTTQITATVSDGQPPFAYDWMVIGDWMIVDGQGTDTVTVEAGEKDDAQLCLVVTDDLGQESDECCVDLCLLVPPQPLMCEVDEPEIGTPGNCLAQTGDMVGVEANVFGGVPEFELNWSVTTLDGMASDWIITDGQDALLVTVEAGTDAQVELCLHVTDAEDATTECCITLCVEKEPPPPPAPVCSFPTPVECIATGETTMIATSVSGGLPPFAYDWMVIGDWMIVDGQGTDAVTVLAGDDDDAQLCLVVTDALGQDSDECCVDLCLSVGEPICTLGDPDPGLPGNCIAQPGDTTEVVANVQDGFPPYDLFWTITTTGGMPSDWMIVAGQGTLEAVVEAGFDLEAELCLLVTDDEGQTGECCVTLCVEDVPPPTCELPIADELECISCPGETTSITAMVDGGQPPLDYAWSITGDWMIVGGQGTETVTVEAGNDSLAELCLVVTDDFGQVSQPCCVELCLDPGEPECVIEPSLPSAGVQGDVVDCGEPSLFCGTPGMAGYAWSVDGEATIIGDDDAECVTVVAGNVDGGSFTLHLEVTNEAGCTSECELTVGITCPPEPPIACRVVAGGNGEDGLNSFSVGGQAGTPTSQQPQPWGNWTHSSSPGSEAGNWTFHAGTPSAPPGTEIDHIQCCDGGSCPPGPPSPAKQIDFQGIGTFSNIISSNFPDGWASDENGAESFHWFEVHMEDLAGSGNPGDHCPPDGFNCGPQTGDCTCPDFYRITIYRGFTPSAIPIPEDEINTTEVMYSVQAYLSGGNLTILPPIGDVTNNLTVGTGDLITLLGSWGANEVGCDFNYDGTVNVVDLLILLSNWGPVN